MHISQLSVTDFRSYTHLELPLEPGITTLVGSNGQGKTNLVEAIGYAASLASHRVTSDAPLVRCGAEQSIVRVEVVRQGRTTTIELEIAQGRPNRARLGKSPVTRTRDILGHLRVVMFAPEDLELVKGDPAQRRRFIDELLVARQPKWAAARADVDKILRQRAALLKSAAPVLRGRGRSRRDIRPEGAIEEDRTTALHTLGVWNEQLARAAAPLLYARLRLLRDLGPLLSQAYREVAAADSPAQVSYLSSLGDPVAAEIAGGAVPEIEDLYGALLTACAQNQPAEIERGVNLVGPHRDDLMFSLGELPAKGYASHGESWSFALGLKLAAYGLLRNDLREDPVLVLDDVFAELDLGRRQRLAELIADCEQVIITAAVADDVPAELRGRRYAVSLGEVHPA